MEPCGWVVPLGHLDRSGLVRHVNDVETVGTAVGVVVLWNGVQVAVGQFVVDKHPVVVGGHLDVNHASDFSVIGGEKNDVVGLGDVQNFELVVRGHIGVTPTGSVGLLLTVFQEIPLDGDFRGVARRGSDVFVFGVAGAAGHVVQFCGRSNVAVAVEVVVVNEKHVFCLQPMSKKVAVTVVLVLDFHDGINPCCSLVSLVVVATIVKAHVRKP